MKTGKAVTVFFGLTLLLTMVTLPVSAEQHQMVGIGVHLNPMWPWKWKVSGCPHCSPDELAELEKRHTEKTDDTIFHVFISQLVCNGPAYKAGLKTGDVVVAIEGNTLSGHIALWQREAREIIELITKGQVGKPVRLTIKRNGNIPEQFDVSVVRESLNFPLSFDCE